MPPLLAQIPWGHNVLLIEKVKDLAERLWYATKTLEHGWSRAILDHRIDSNVYRRQGKAVTNFPRTLPPPQSDLAGEVLKDPFNFDFLTLAEDARERELQKGLLAHIRQFLLELGAGFAFVGENVHLDVGGEHFYVDLLFYHLKLRAFIVADLKTRAFKPGQDAFEHPGADPPPPGLLLLPPLRGRGPLGPDSGPDSQAVDARCRRVGDPGRDRQQ
jgi:predicted nuclease of restriction endonuclease-like (RecB) superfamily